MGIPTTDKTTKDAFCQEKSTSRSLFTLADFGFENGNNGQYFFGIWQLPRERTTCINLEFHQNKIFVCMRTYFQPHFRQFYSTRSQRFQQVKTDILNSRDSG